MKTRLMIVLVVVALLLVSGAVAWAQSVGKDPPAWYQVERGMLSGGHYHLAGLMWQFDGPTSGDGYRLSSPIESALASNGCCCTFLPCLLNNAH